MPRWSCRRRRSFDVTWPSAGNPEEREPGAGDWLWRELWAADGARMAGGYRDLGHCALRRLGDAGDRDEWQRSSGDQPQAGLIDKSRMWCS